MTENILTRLEICERPSSETSGSSGGGGHSQSQLVMWDPTKVSDVFLDGESDLLDLLHKLRDLRLPLPIDWGVLKWWPKSFKTTHDPWSPNTQMDCDIFHVRTGNIWTPRPSFRKDGRKVPGPRVPEVRDLTNPEECTGRVDECNGERVTGDVTVMVRGRVTLTVPSTCLRDVFGIVFSPSTLL